MHAEVLTLYSKNIEPTSKLNMQPPQFTYVVLTYIYTQVALLASATYSPDGFTHFISNTVVSYLHCDLP